MTILVTNQVETDFLDEEGLTVIVPIMLLDDSSVRLKTPENFRFGDAKLPIRTR